MRHWRSSVQVYIKNYWFISPVSIGSNPSPHCSVHGSLSFCKFFSSRTRHHLTHFHRPLPFVHLLQVLKTSYHLCSSQWNLPTSFYSIVFWLVGFKGNRYGNSRPRFFHTLPQHLIVGQSSVLSMEDCQRGDSASRCARVQGIVENCIWRLFVASSELWMGLHVLDFRVLLLEPSSCVRFLFKIIVVFVTNAVVG